MANLMAKTAWAPILKGIYKSLAEYSFCLLLLGQANVFARSFACPQISRLDRCGPGAKMSVFS